MKITLLSLLLVPSLALAGVAPQSGHGNVAHHHLARMKAVKAHPVSPNIPRSEKFGPGKSRRCAAITASISSASVSSTSVHAEQTHHTTTTTTHLKPKPTTTTTQKPKPTQKDEDDDTKDDDNKGDDDKDDDNGSSGDGKTYTGDATFYETGLNACGTVDKPTDMIAAIAWQNFDSYPGANGNSNENPICGKQVEACWQDNCVTVRIHDRCGGCQANDLDFSPAAFKKLADLDLGRLKGMKWRYI
ncbi:hypothetical protein FRC00_002621 [Tulasnella sp. 408]|nr:hypothetical protein FRC00_002621 [Tulasnella sp. 408]